MKLRRKLIAATAALTLATGAAVAPTAGAQTSLENPAQASYELSVQSPLGVGSIIAGGLVYYFVICPVMLTTGSWENDGRCTF